MPQKPFDKNASVSSGVEERERERIMNSFVRKKEVFHLVFGDKADNIGMVPEIGGRVQ